MWFLSSLGKRRHAAHRFVLRDSAISQKLIPGAFLFNPKTKGGYAMHELSMSSALHCLAWRNRLVRQQSRLEQQTTTRFSHTNPDRSVRVAVAGFVFINLTDRKEVNSHE